MSHPLIYTIGKQFVLNLVRITHFALPVSIKDQQFTKKGSFKVFDYNSKTIALSVNI